MLCQKTIIKNGSFLFARLVTLVLEIVRTPAPSKNHGWDGGTDENRLFCGIVKVLFGSNPSHSSKRNNTKNNGTNCWKTDRILYMNSVEYFNQVRDIPYSIPIHQNNQDNCCNGKVRKLKNLVEREGYKTRYRVCTFRWSDLNIPKEILELQKEDLATHVYLEVLVGENWIKVDPTWDSGLKNIFSIAEWDGKTDTLLAVSPIEIYSVE